MSKNSVDYGSYYIKNVSIFQGDLSLVINDSITNLNISTAEYVPVVAAGIAFGTLVVIGILAIIAFVCTLIYGRRKINEVWFFPSGPKKTKNSYSIPSSSSFST